MNIEKKLEGDTLTIALDGRLDTTTSPDLEEVLGASLDAAAALVFDFAKLDYLSSAGLRVLLSAQKRMNAKHGSMKLVHVNDAVKEVFDITGFADFLTVE
ncbi:MAG: STAS domain-containing protein [Kiritimatiellae bacterium]|nr:STAS domain-containing protein [Kiritimatiellia bacterium]